VLGDDGTAGLPPSHGIRVHVESIVL